MSVDAINEALLLDLLPSSLTGVLWSAESDDLDCNFVSWRGGDVVAEHTNSEVDVLFVVLSGNGCLVIDGSSIELQPGAAVLVAKNSTRSVIAGTGGLAYLTVHKRRKRLMPGDVRSRIPGQLSLKER